MASYSALKAALGLLLEAYEIARNSRSEAWHWAPSAKELLAEGVGRRHLHLLVQNGYCECCIGKARGTTKDQPLRGVGYRAIHAGSRLMLSPAGVMLARQILYPLAKSRNGNNTNRRSGDSSFPDLTLPAIPRWDMDNHELWWGKYLIKRFTRPAPNLEAILTALQESKWSEHVANIQRPDGRRVNKYQLREAIKTWNDSSCPDFIAFRGDGSGLGVRWERMK